MAEAVIFDLDGVLVNTVPAHNRAWAALAAQHNIPFDMSDASRFLGVHRKDCVRLLFEPRQLTEAEISAFSEIKNQHYLEILNQSRPEDLITPGAIRLIEAASKAGDAVGIASSSTNAMTVTQRTGLYDMVAVVADGNTVVRNKPAPDIFLWAAGALRVKPEACLVFEDSAAGAAAARTAGMRVIGIGDRERLSEAHEVYPYLQDIPLSVLDRTPVTS